MVPPVSLSPDVISKLGITCCLSHVPEMARKVHDALFVDGDGASIKRVSSGSHAPAILSQAGNTRKVLGLGASELLPWLSRGLMFCASKRVGQK